MCLRYLHILLYDMKYMCKERVLVFKKVVTNKWLNEITEVVRDKCHHAEHRQSSTYGSRIMSLGGEIREQNLTCEQVCVPSACT